MSNAIKLLIDVLYELRDHQLLVEVGIQLSKVPDSKNTYLYTEDREEYSKNALKLCQSAAWKSIPRNPTFLLNRGLNIYDTYTKFQKHNKENLVAPVLLEVYKRHCENQVI